jgi:hypothetical protein
MKAKLRPAVAALVLFAPAAMSVAPAFAQAADSQHQQPASALRIQALTLNADEGLKPGSRLQLEMHATPGGRASVNFGKSDIRVQLHETSSGTYKGRYVVREGDRIDPTAMMVASLSRGDSTERHSFTYPPSFQALARQDDTAVASAAPAAKAQQQRDARERPERADAAAPRIERFETLPVDRLQPGSELRYRVLGAPGARATFDIPGIATGVAMREVRPGVYEGSYVVRDRDDPDNFSVAVATLRSGNRWARSRLDNAYVVLDPDHDSTTVEVRRRVRDHDAAPGTLPLRISAANGAVVGDDGRLELEGRTAPDARVHIRVDAVPMPRRRMYGVAETIYEDTVRADPDGHFVISILPRHGRMEMPAHYEVTLHARDGDATAEAHITVRERG